LIFVRCGPKDFVYYCRWICYLYHILARSILNFVEQ
jgi:hypothetical protein